MEDSANQGKNELRQAARYPVRWPVRLGNCDACTRDISATGIYLTSTEAVELASMLRFSIQLPKRQGMLEHLECEGLAVRVEHLAAGLFGIAIALQDFRFIF